MGKYNKIFSRIMLKSLKVCTSIVTIASCNNNIISNENFNSEKLKDIWEDIENIQHALKADVVNIDDHDIKNEVYHYLARIIKREVVLDDTCVSTLKIYSYKLKDSSQMAESLKTLSENIQQYIAQEIYDSTVQNNNEEINDNTNKTECCNSVNYTSPSAKKENTTPSTFKPIHKEFLSYDNKILTYDNSHLTLKQSQNQKKRRRDNDAKRRRDNDAISSFQQCFLINELLKHGYVITIEKVSQNLKKQHTLFNIKSIEKDNRSVFNGSECVKEVERDIKNKTIPSAFTSAAIRKFFYRRLNKEMIRIFKGLGYKFFAVVRHKKPRDKAFRKNYQTYEIGSFWYNNQTYFPKVFYQEGGEQLYRIIYDKVQKQDYKFTEPLLITTVLPSRGDEKFIIAK